MVYRRQMPMKPKPAAKIGIKFIKIGVRYLLRCVIASQVFIKKADNDPKGIFGFRNVRVVKESMKQPFPDMELGIYAQVYQLLVRVGRQTAMHFELYESRTVEELGCNRT